MLHAQFKLLAEIRTALRIGKFKVNVGGRWFAISRAQCF
jgi:hypothetical protein